MEDDPQFCSSERTTGLCWFCSPPEILPWCAVSTPGWLAVPQQQCSIQVCRQPDEWAAMWAEGMLVLQHTSCPSHIPPPILQWCPYLPLLWTSQDCSQSQAQRNCSKKNQRDNVFPRFFHHFTDIFVHTFLNPDWAANSWRTHNSCDILNLTACTPLQAMKYIAAQVFLRPKTQLYRFYIASCQLKHEMCCHLQPGSVWTSDTVKRGVGWFKTKREYF